MKNSIDIKVFSEYLMDKVDEARVFLTLEEFCNIEFSVYGIPRFIVNILTKFTSFDLEAYLY
jgi:hypothetical protein